MCNAARLTGHLLGVILPHGLYDRQRTIINFILKLIITFSQILWHFGYTRSQIMTVGMANPRIFVL
jgi:hypothetical protein